MLFVNPFILCNIANRIYRTRILSKHCRDSHSDYLIITCSAFVFNLTSLNLQKHDCPRLFKCFTENDYVVYVARLIATLAWLVERSSDTWEIRVPISTATDRKTDSDSYISTANVFGNRCRILIPLLFFLFSFDILWCWWITAERLVLKTINYC